MSVYLGFLIIGLGVGAAYVALAQGLVVVYKATGIINFAQAAMAVWAAYTYDEIRKTGTLVLPIGQLHVGDHLMTAIVLGVASAALLGLVAHVCVFRPLRSAPMLAKVIASIGLMLMLQIVMTMRFSSSPRA